MIDSHTWPDAKAPSSRRRPFVGSVPALGTMKATPSSATTPITVIAQNVERQPKFWPSNVPKGTPRTLAAVRPVNMIAMAPAFLCAGTRLAATTEPIPKKAPWHSAATIRPSSMAE
ncbi:hypothetical protein PJL18_02390 [Paenarthrobacter nicotinovorans]|nr:hypothetical protein [Paenarthrobacter nicotinovorans]